MKKTAKFTIHKAADLRTVYRSSHAQLGEVNVRLDKVAKAIESGRDFTRENVSKIMAGLRKADKKVAQLIYSSLGNVRVAIHKGGDTTSNLDPMVLKAYETRGKIALLRNSLKASLAEEEEDILQIDDNGYVVEPTEEITDELPEDAMNAEGELSEEEVEEMTEEGEAPVEEELEDLEIPEEAAEEEETPVEETPVEETPVEETPAEDELPVEEETALTKAEDELPEVPEEEPPAETLEQDTEAMDEVLSNEILGEDMPMDEEPETPEASTAKYKKRSTAASRRKAGETPATSDVVADLISQEVFA